MEDECPDSRFTYVPRSAQAVRDAIFCLFLLAMYSDDDEDDDVDEVEGTKPSAVVAATRTKAAVVIIFIMIRRRGERDRTIGGERRFHAEAILFFFSFLHDDEYRLHSVHDHRRLGVLHR